MGKNEIVLKNLLERLNYDDYDEIFKKLNIFIDIMLSWNEKFNITAITERDEVFYKHIIDSIVVCNYVDFEDKKVIDVGSGAGFPGLPIYLVNPCFDLTLVDSRKKKSNFLKMVVNELSLEHVQVINKRAEEVGRSEEYREKFDISLSRAVAGTRVLLELCFPLIKTGGIFISWEKEGEKNDKEKSSNNDLKNALSILRGVHIRNDFYGKWLKNSFKLNEIDKDRYLSIFKKTNTVSSKYPRKPGIPNKRPL